jgi:hypothetical protein
VHRDRDAICIFTRQIPEEVTEFSVYGISTKEWQFYLIRQTAQVFFRLSCNVITPAQGFEIKYESWLGAKDCDTFHRVPM